MCLGFAPLAVRGCTRARYHFTLQRLRNPCNGDFIPDHTLCHCPTTVCIRPRGNWHFAVLTYIRCFPTERALPLLYTVEDMRLRVRVKGWIYTLLARRDSNPQPID